MIKDFKSSSYDDSLSDIKSEIEVKERVMLLTLIFLVDFVYDLVEE